MGETIKSHWRFLMVYLVFVKMLNLLGQILCAIGQIFIWLNDQKLKNNQGSHLVTLVGCIDNYSPAPLPSYGRRLCRNQTIGKIVNMARYILRP